MKTHHLIILAVVASVAVPAAAAQDADAILRAMSDKLARSKTFTFSATREIDAALRDGHAVPEKARVKVAVARPDRITAVAVSREGTRRIVSDGRKLTVADETAGFYAQVPMRATIDRLVDQLDAVYGFTPPVAEFALSDVHADLRRQARSISYLGTGKVGGFLGLGGTPCHRIALAGRKADAELWIAESDQLPRQLVATFRQPGRPQLRVVFSSWNLAAPLTAADFAFTPRPGAGRIELWSTARRASARKH